MQHDGNVRAIDDAREKIDTLGGQTANQQLSDGDPGHRAPPPHTQMGGPLHAAREVHRSRGRRALGRWRGLVRFSVRRRGDVASGIHAALTLRRFGAQLLGVGPFCRLEPAECDDFRGRGELSNIDLNGAPGRGRDRSQRLLNFSHASCARRDTSEGDSLPGMSRSGREARRGVVRSPSDSNPSSLSRFWFRCSGRREARLL